MSVAFIKIKFCACYCHVTSVILVKLVTSNSRQTIVISVTNKLFLLFRKRNIANNPSGIFPAQHKAASRGDVTMIDFAARGGL